MAVDDDYDAGGAGGAGGGGGGGGEVVVQDGQEHVATVFHPGDSGLADAEPRCDFDLVSWAALRIMARSIAWTRSISSASAWA